MTAFGEHRSRSPLVTSEMRQIRKSSLVAGARRVAITVSVRESKAALVDNMLDDLMRRDRI
jgi:hypothetical protein